MYKSGLRKGFPLHLIVGTHVNNLHKMHVYCIKSWCKFHVNPPRRICHEYKCRGIVQVDQLVEIVYRLKSRDILEAKSKFENLKILYIPREKMCIM